jgi:HSP20 family protein
MSQLQNNTQTAPQNTAPQAATTQNPSEQISPARTFTPRVDIYENAKELLVIADLPGVSADQLDVRLERDTLSIEGRVQKLRDDLEAFTYQRSFKIPRGIDPQHIAADLKHGVLTLHLPRQTQPVSRQITVRAE